MQTDQDEQQNQGDSPKEPEEKPCENEEMEVRSSVLYFKWRQSTRVNHHLSDDYLNQAAISSMMRWAVVSVLCYDSISELNLESF